MKLTKKYRIWWNQEKIIQNDYLTEHINGITYCGNVNCEYFESNTFQDIQNKIKKEELIKKENNDDFV